MKKYLALDGVFEASRMFVGAVSASYLIQKGLHLQDIALLKIIQSVVVVFGEVPTGVFADRLGRRWSLLISLLCLIFGYALVIAGAGFFAFAIAEILVALSLCFWSGAYEAYSLSELEKSESKFNVDKFFHLNSSINAFSVIVSGLLGAYLAGLNSELPYVLSVCTFASLFLMIVFRFPRDEGLEKQIKKSFDLSAFLKRLANDVKATMKLAFQSKKVGSLFVASMALEACLQPVFHYWQPFFASLSPNKNLGSLGNVFACFQLVIFGASLVWSWISENRFAKSLPSVAAGLGLFGALLALVGSAGSFFVALIGFSLMQGPLAIVRSILKSRIASAVESTHRASVFSGLSLYGRLSGIWMLVAISQAMEVREPSGQVQVVSVLYKSIGLSALFVSVLIVIWHLARVSSTKTENALIQEPS